jgi:SPW repeat
MRTMLEWTWTRDRVLDLTKLICGALLLASTWALEFAPLPAWNLRVCGYASLTASLAALVAEADWEPRANLWLGLWLLAAPWMLGFTQDPAAVLVHMIGGGLICMLSAVEVWSGERSPPWRFGPAAAQRATLPAHAMTVALGQTTSQPVTAVRRRPIPLEGVRFAASPVNLRPFRSSGHHSARRLQVSAGTRRLGRRACARLRSALEHRTRQIRSPCRKHVSNLAQMAAGV